MERIRDLVIPPAWKKVWICPYPNGHIQAVGTDAAGRRQYLYHQKWQEERNEEKFDRVLEMSAALPDMRRRIAADLRRRGLERDRVLALALHLLDLGYFRAGGEQYAEENNSYGIATLLCEHVALNKEAVEFDYPAKSGVRRTLLIDDPEVVRSVRALLRRAGPAPSASWCAATVPVGSTFTPRTSTRGSRNWSATSTRSRTCAPGTAPCWPPRRSSMRILRSNKTVIKRVESAVMKEVAEELGNTPAVARSSYVDPRVVEGYESGLTITAGARRASRTKAPAERQAILESSTARLIRKVAKG